MTIQPDIKECGPEELKGIFRDLGQPEYRAAQVYNWIFYKGAESFDSMTNLPKSLRALLDREFTISRLPVLKSQKSSDGTHKILLGLADGESIESVLIPERDHWTLCGSTQVGCAMGCAFCLTGTGGLTRNLTPGEIIGQVQAAKNEAGPELPLKNIVFMGMGEPLANYDHLLQALRVITDPRGLAFSWRKVTVSTSGLPEKMVQLMSEIKIRLAISLNAPDDRTRDEIMPVNRIHPLSELMAGLKNVSLRPGERITLEYVLLKGVNDSPDQAETLVRLLKPMAERVKVNLILFNEHPGSRFKRPTREAAEVFQSRLIQAHLTTLIRRSMGSDILAACGQLRGEG